MRKKLIRRNKYNIAIVIIYVIICFILNYYGVFDLSHKNSQYHLNMLTVNSIFLGFLFTSLGIMVGFSDKKIVKSLNTAGYMDNYYNSIYFGLLLLVISTIISTVGVAIGYEYITKIVSFIQQVSFIGGVLFFIKSIFGLMKLIRFIRKEK